MTSPSEAAVIAGAMSRKSPPPAASTIQVLACAIAHEIGHLLMPGVQHSADGLMRARWGRDDVSRADQGRLRFSAAQVALIRARAAGDRSRER